MPVTKHQIEIGVDKKVSPVVPTATDPTHAVPLQQVEEIAAASGGGNVPAGAFTGVLDVSGGNKYYDDYTSGAVVNLSLSTTKALGATATVRISGNLTGTIPTGWNLSGQPISSNAANFNELTLLYEKSGDVRIVNRVVSNPNYIPYIDWEQEIHANDLGDGTLEQAATSGTVGWSSGAYSSKAINNNNAVIFTVPQVTEIGSVVGLNDTGVTIKQDGTANPLTNVKFYVLVNTRTMEYSFGESGATQFTGTWTHGSDLTLRRNNGAISLEKDGTTVYTSGSAVPTSLTVIGLHHGDYRNSEITNCRFETTNNLVTSPI